MRLFEVGHDVWVGDFEACDARLAEFELGIHVIRQTNVREGRICRFSRAVVEKRSHQDLVVMYRENEPLDQAWVPLDNIIEYARRPGRILCHCTAGACRGPTMAILAKSARGCDPFVASGEVLRGLQRAGEVAPFGNRGLRSIFEWWQRCAG